MIALLSYDQVQHTDEGLLSLSYWTIVGAYIIKGEKNDTSTMIDAAVYHIPSRKMLFRAPGTSHIKGRATPVNLSEQLRADSLTGFQEAADDLVVNTQDQLERFKAKVKESPQEYRVEHKPGYTGGGSLGGGPVGTRRRGPVAGTRSLRGRIPRLTLAVAACAVAAHLWPALGDLLVYDRASVLHGEVWRLVTAPMTHFSTSHLLWDLVVLCAAGWVVEAEGDGDLALVWGFTAAATGAIVLLEPTVARYGGLSGLAVGAVAHLCLSRGSGRGRVVWLVILVLLAGKLLLESMGLGPFFAAPAGEPFRVLPEAHAMGLLAAVVAHVWRRRRAPGRVEEKPTMEKNRPRRSVQAT